MYLCPGSEFLTLPGVQGLKSEYHPFSPFNPIERGVLQLNFEENAVCCRIHIYVLSKIAQIINKSKDSSFHAPAISKYEFG